MKRLRREAAVVFLVRILVLLNSQRHATERRTQGDHLHQSNNRNLPQHRFNLTLLTQWSRRTSGSLVDTATHNVSSFFSPDHETSNSHPLQQPPRRAQQRENTNRTENTRPYLIGNTRRVDPGSNTEARTNDSDYAE